MMRYVEYALIEWFHITLPLFTSPYLFLNIYDITNARMRILTYANVVPILGNFIFSWVATLSKLSSQKHAYIILTPLNP